MRKWIPAVAVLGALILSGCNTVAGAGEDVSLAGDAMTKAAVKTKAKL